MAYDLRQWPASVYPGEVQAFPDAAVDVDAALLALARNGPQLEEYGFKTLGKKLGHLWQINLKIVATKRQVRILYAPYSGTCIVIFHIHKKSSGAEQRRAYALAMKRKKTS
jgi:hypothetical protein